MKKLASLLTIVGVVAVAVSAQTGAWTDISTALTNQLNQSGTAICPLGCGCAGVVVDRLTGDVVIGVGSFGLWRSSNQGSTWARIDSGTVNAAPRGKMITGWAIQVDQENPKRIAAFDLDGSSGYTVDGIHWKPISVNSIQNSRGWDFGSVDSATQDVKVMLALNHEASGAIYKTIDGAATWQKLLVSANPGIGVVAMIGVMDATTFIYSNGNGISRSTDQGATWTQVSAINPQSLTPVMFKGVAYLGTANGLLVSTDKGASWQIQGASVNIYQGPFFGADENTMVVVGTQGVYKTSNAAVSWTKISPLCPPIAGNTFYTFDPKWFGCYSWDPINNIVYATAETNPAFKCAIPGASTLSGNLQTTGIPSRTLAIIRNTIHSGIPFNHLAAFSFSGKLMYEQRMAPSYSAPFPSALLAGNSPLVLMVTTAHGTSFRAMVLTRP